jgi:hypothetical protein
MTDFNIPGSRLPGNNRLNIGSERLLGVGPKQP